MKQAVYIALFVVPLFTNSMAQDGGIFPKGEKSPNNDHHIGTVYLKELNAPDSIFNYSIAVATFEPASYLFWHIHPGGQILLITDGTGYYQEKGKPKQTVRKGDVVKCQPGVEHWHGATPQSGVTYLATSPAQKGRTIWLSKVTEQEYSSKQ